MKQLKSLLHSRNPSTERVKTSDMDNKKTEPYMLCATSSP